MPTSRRLASSRGPTASGSRTRTTLTTTGARRPRAREEALLLLISGGGKRICLFLRSHTSSFQATAGESSWLSHGRRGVRPFLYTRRGRFFDLWRASSLMFEKAIHVACCSSTIWGWHCRLGVVGRGSSLCSRSSDDSLQHVSRLASSVRFDGFQAKSTLPMNRVDDSRRQRVLDQRFSPQPLLLKLRVPVL